MSPKFDFDRVPDRSASDSLKWKGRAALGVIPLWVADMDFPAPPAVLDAIRRRVDHGILGYASAPPETVSAVVDALRREYDWVIDPSWLVWLPGVVPALQNVCRMLPQPDDGIVTFTPIYPPFLYPSVLRGHPQTRIPLVERAGRFEIDFDGLDAAVPAGARVLFWCHPQNPTGRVFDRAELERIAEFCARRDLILVSDEIHCGLVLESGRRHMPTASLSPEIAARTITLMAPSKTYNLPGLCCAFAVISDPELRRRFRGVEAGQLPPVNILGYVACAAAYRDSTEWHAALLDYLRGNRDLVESELAGLPGLRVIHAEGTYLSWIDARGLGQADPAAFFRAAGVEFSDGVQFGAPGWLRLNFGCPRDLLRKALRRMRQAVENRE